MNIKSYFAETVKDAMDAARQELGPDALILASRRSAPEAQHLGRYEVIFAVEHGNHPAAELVPLRRQPPQADRLAGELADLRRQLDRMRRSIGRSNWSGPRWPSPGSETAELYSALLGSDVPVELAQQLVDAIQANQPIENLEKALASEMKSRFSVDSDLSVLPDGLRVVALVGPPGSGKTTTLVKLAVTCGLAARVPVQLLSADTDRVSACEQLRSYAAILGVNFQILETLGAVAQALAVNARKGLLLLDTPGYGAHDLDRGRDLARYLASRPDIQVHLVLTASPKPADLTRVIDRFEIFRPARLLFTGLDETDSFGPVFAEAARTGKPLSFFSTGQRVPEDLEPASQERLIDLILRSALSRDNSQGVPGRDPGTGRIRREGAAA
jgi:flagellar biosynthesis protein FlhF